MKKLITVVFSVLCFSANATTYYFAASGNDANAGTSTTAPWKTLAKFNSVFASKSAGDNFLFNRGDVFYGNMVISRSGASGSPITIGAYGSGAQPVISGFTTVAAWTGLGSNIWESTNTASALAATNMVVIGGVNTPMGRYPNSGYLPYQSFSGTTSITSSSLSGTPNWAGAEAVIRKQRWIIDRNPVTAQSGGTLTYKATSTYTGQANYGFFIQNDVRTLDAQNEWYYNPTTKKLRVYSVATPSNVQVATKDTLVYIRLRGYLTFDNLNFQGSNKDAFVILSSNNVTIQNCTIDYSGGDAIWGAQNLGSPSSAFVLQNTTINHTDNDAINLQSEFTGALISHNLIKNTGVIVGMGNNGATNYGSYEAVQTNAINTTIEYNEIDSTGYIGIAFNNSNAMVRNNLVNGYCSVKLDGAGIYTAGSGFTGQKIQNNIVINGIGDNAGTNATGAPIAHGIYMDEGSGNIEVSGNTTANCSHTGIYLHNSHNNNVHNNTSFNNGVYQGLFSSFSTTSPIRNNIIRNNIYVSKAATQYTGSFQSIANDIASFGSLDSNYWARPIDDNITINYSINSYSTGGNFTLAQWQAYSLQDAHSKKSPKTVTTVNDIRFEYNASTASKPVTLDGNYIDIKGVTYNGSITLQPYTSAVLIRTGAASNQAPVANAGTPQTITLPTSGVTLTGSGSDADGTVTAYSWTKLSGPATGAITSPSLATTTLTSLSQGTYVYQLTVTDNGGLTGVSTVQVTVNAAGLVLLPAVNPANTVNGLNYKYYQASAGYSVVPVFAGLTAVKSGTSSTFDLTLANRATKYAFNFTGYVNVPADGQYTFYTTSDDGSNLLIDGVLVVNNDGLHGAMEKSGTIGLKAGKHVISVGFFNQTGASTLIVSYSATGISKQAIPASALYRVATQALDNPIAMSAPGIQSISSEVSVKAYPNPFTSYIEINITGGVAGDYKLILVNAVGQTVWTKSGVKTEGSFQETINTSTLQRGAYFLKVIQNNNNSSVIKLVK